MKLKKLKSDDRAVSPVIGVILMVAITVILAAVIATFVLGLGDSLSSTAPQASFEFDYTDGPDDGNLEISHSSGETLESEDVSVTFSGTDDGSSASVTSTFPTKITAGSTATASDVDTEQTVKVVWESPNGGNSAIIASWKGPDA